MERFDEVILRKIAVSLNQENLLIAEDVWPRLFEPFVREIENKRSPRIDICIRERLFIYILKYSGNVDFCIPCVCVCGRSGVCRAMEYYQLRDHKLTLLQSDCSCNLSVYQKIYDVIFSVSSFLIFLMFLLFYFLNKYKR